MSKSISLNEQDITEDMIPENSSDREMFWALAEMGRDGFNEFFQEELSRADEEIREPWKNAPWKKDIPGSIQEALIVLTSVTSSVHWGEPYPLEGKLLEKAEKTLEYIRSKLKKKPRSNEK
jgi:hypothetical protein